MALRMSIQPWLALVTVISTMRTCFQTSRYELLGELHQREEFRCANREVNGMAEYIRELLDLPSQVSKGDFVLNLSAGVSANNASATLRNYVVTPQLEACFDQALGFIKSAVDANSSKACYLHGSFGSGKSHFMAVLHLLLQIL